MVDALKDSDLNFVVIYPNNDTGSEIIVDEISKLKKQDRFKLVTSMRFEYYLTLLKHSSTIIGNSSAGICEAPVYGIPSVNIGTRQNKRFNCDSIIHLPEKSGKLLQVLKNLPKKKSPSLHFGKGNSAKLFSDILKKENFWKRSCQKTFREI